MTSDEDISADEARSAPVAGAGAQLRAAREARKLELTHIAAETRIPLRHLEAIEAGNFDALPSRAYALGFSRSFARAVGMDEAALSALLRAELADRNMGRPTTISVMEPGDPAKLPSPGLAWAGAAAALILAVGVISFFNAYFGAGGQPGPLIAEEPASASAGNGTGAQAAAAPAPSGEVVFTATEDGVWLRLYEDGGERLVERTLKLGETVTVPAGASDPRINTGRPDALAVTIGGTSVAPLAASPQNMSGAPVSAAALLARADTAADSTAATTGSSVPRPQRRAAQPRPARVSAEEPATTAETPASAAPAPVAAPAPAPATSPENGDGAPT